MQSYENVYKLEIHVSKNILTYLHSHCFFICWSLQEIPNSDQCINNPALLVLDGSPTLCDLYVHRHMVGNFQISVYIV